MEVLDRFIYNCFAKLDECSFFRRNLYYQNDRMVLAYKSKDSKKEKEEKMRRAILQALEDRYNAQISEADATIKIYLESSVGIGEHPQHIDKK